MIVKGFFCQNVGFQTLSGDYFAMNKPINKATKTIAPNIANRYLQRSLRLIRLSRLTAGEPISIRKTVVTKLPI